MILIETFIDKDEAEAFMRRADVRVQDVQVGVDEGGWWFAVIYKSHKGREE